MRTFIILGLLLLVGYYAVVDRNAFGDHFGTAQTWLRGDADASAPAPTTGGGGFRGTIDHVADGDTVTVRTRAGELRTLRLIGVDTPETKHPHKPVQCGGPEASAFTTRMLPKGTAVRVAFDPTQGRTDRYGRTLGYLYVGDHSGAGGSVNYLLVRKGLAKTYVYDNTPFRYATRFMHVEDMARDARIGLWGPPCNGDTDQPAR